MTKRAELQEYCEVGGFHVATYSPGDGVTRYRFFTKDGNDYFGPDEGDWTALGLKEAWAYARGRRQGWIHAIRVSLGTA